MAFRGHIKVISVVIGLSLIGACADQKGFRARLTTPEDLLKQKGIDPKSEEGQKLLAARKAAVGKGEQREVDIPPERPGNRAQNGTEAERPSRGNPTDQAVIAGFAEIVRGAVKESPTPQGPKPVNPKAAQAPTAAELAEKNRLEKIAKLKAINDSLNPSITDLLKGIDVRVVRVGDATAQVKDQNYSVNVDLFLVFEGKSYLSSSEGVLSGKNQLKSADIVDLKVTREFSGTDLAEKKIKGLEYYATCDSEKQTCDTVQVMILFNRVDSTKISFIGKFRFDGSGLGTSLGDQLKTVAEAQSEFTKAEIERQKRLTDSEKPATASAQGKVAPAAEGGATVAERPKTQEDAGQRVWKAVREQDRAKIEADLKAYLSKEHGDEAAKPAKANADGAKKLEAAEPAAAKPETAKPATVQSAASAPVAQVSKVSESVDAKFIASVGREWNKFWSERWQEVRDIFYSGPITSRFKQGEAPTKAATPATAASSAAAASAPAAAASK